uniref:Uncharacterized protein n=1 Tax=Mantoniella antarctica TaxID=81844 RepID=A0A7S0SQ27_9CHLO|mmetsp:Transcript_32160/g.80868  ORF Transcript_32160/g.80868 Transcript_32160/m.80868 type:complete len:566 (+) Transcript_32160:217-1914(+)
MANLVNGILGNVFLLVLIFGLAAQVDLKEFRQRFNKPIGIIIGLVCQFVFLPVAGFASIRIFFPDNPVYGIPLLVTVCSPGGSYSNWWCSLFNSDLPLSMAMTTASSLFAVATLPVNILIYLRLCYPDKDGSVALDWGGLFTSLALVVVGIFGGLLVGTKVPRWRDRLGKLGNLAGVCLVLLGFFFSSNSSAPIWARGLSFYIGVGVPCIFGLVISMCFAYTCGLPKPQCLSVMIETCYQNTAIPLAVILSSFSNDDVALCESIGVYAAGHPKANRGDSAVCDVVGIAAGVPTFYQVVQVFALGVVCLCGWKAGWTYAPPDHSMWKVLTSNYQPGTADEDEPEPEAQRLSEGGFGSRLFPPSDEEQRTQLDGVVTEEVAGLGDGASSATYTHDKAAKVRGLHDTDAVSPVKICAGASNTDAAPAGNGSSNGLASRRVDGDGGDGGGGQGGCGDRFSLGMGDDSGSGSLLDMYGSGHSLDSELEAGISVIGVSLDDGRQLSAPQPIRNGGCGENGETIDAASVVLMQTPRGSVGSVTIDLERLRNLDTHPLPPSPLRKINQPNRKM